MHTQKTDQIMLAFYRWDAKIKSCKEQDLFDICRQSQTLVWQLLNLVFGIHLVDLDRTLPPQFSRRRPRRNGWILCAGYFSGQSL